MFKRIFFLLLLAFSFLSCHTIHFVNSGESAAAAGALHDSAEWHHIGIFGLVEFSPPVDVQEICGDRGWRSVRSQTNIAQGAVRHVAPGILNYINAGLGPALSFIYTAEEASVFCK